MNDNPKEMAKLKKMAREVMGYIGDEIDAEQKSACPCPLMEGKYCPLLASMIPSMRHLK